MRHGLCLLIPKDKSQAFETVTKKTALNLLYGTQDQEFYIQRGHHPHWIPANPTKNSQSGWAIPPSTTLLSQNHSLANSGKRSAPRWTQEELDGNCEEVDWLYHAGPAQDQHKR